MSPHVPRPTTHPSAASPWWKLVDWRTVAAIGLPLWAFVCGVVVARKPSAPPAPEAPPVGAVAPAPDEGIPPPREIVIRTTDPQVITVPTVVAVPVAAAADLALPAEFRLPDAELMPDHKCKTFDTKVRFHRGPAEAAAEAKASKKMMFVLHISGNFEDPGFT
jgi:hypothetical protein